MHALPQPARDPFDNQLLAALPAPERLRWQEQLELVSLLPGQVLAESGLSLAHAYFPTTAVVSLLYVTAAGESFETAVVGNDGMVGMSLFLGGDTMPSRAVVHDAGQAYRLRAHVLKAEAARAGPTLMILLQYAQTLIAQFSQAAACNRYHSIDQRFARRLLVGLHRQHDNSMEMTQELLAGLLGVRREGVTAAALKLQRYGVIRYSRGHIDVLDRSRLALHSCECYATACRAYSQPPMPLAA